MPKKSRNVRNVQNFSCSHRATKKTAPRGVWGLWGHSRAGNFFYAWPAKPPPPLKKPHQGGSGGHSPQEIFSTSGRRYKKNCIYHRGHAVNCRTWLLLVAPAVLGCRLLLLAASGCLASLHFNFPLHHDNTCSWVSLMGPNYQNSITCRMACKFVQNASQNTMKRVGSSGSRKDCEKNCEC